jgi:sugar transferase EpsL
MFNVRPGITGWAQINGRKGVEWHDLIKLSVFYVEHLTMWLDIKIFFLTFFKVFTNADNENTGATVTTPATAEKEAEVSAEEDVTVTETAGR